MQTRFLCTEWLAGVHHSCGGAAHVVLLAVNGVDATIKDKRTINRLFNFNLIFLVFFFS